MRRIFNWIDSLSLFGWLDDVVGISITVKIDAQLAQLRRSAVISLGAHAIPSPKETGVPRFPSSLALSKIIARSVKSKAVNTLVRARKRQARAAIWSPFLRDSGTGGKARSKFLTPIRTLRCWVGMGWQNDRPLTFL